MVSLGAEQVGQGKKAAGEMRYKKVLGFLVSFPFYSNDIRKRFFTEKVVGHWGKLPRAVVMALSLPDFKKC